MITGRAEVTSAQRAPDAPITPPRWDQRRAIAIVSPVVLIVSTYMVFQVGVDRLGERWGYLIGFVFFWVVWCLALPIALLGWRGVRRLLRPAPLVPAGAGVAYAKVYTSSMSKIVPSREFRTHLAELLDEVADRREHITVTRRGRPAAVLVPVDEYEALEETAAILSDDDTLVAIRRGLHDLAFEDVVTLEQVRDEHAGRERT
jgi:antitoxin YefM